MMTAPAPATTAPPDDFLRDLARIATRVRTEERLPLEVRRLVLDRIYDIGFILEGCKPDVVVGNEGDAA